MARKHKPIGSLLRQICDTNKSLPSEVEIKRVVADVLSAGSTMDIELFALGTDTAAICCQLNLLVGLKSPFVRSAAALDAVKNLREARRRIRARAHQSRTQMHESASVDGLV